MVNAAALFNAIRLIQFPINSTNNDKKDQSMNDELSAVPDITGSAIPAPPEALGEAGTRLWTQIHSEFDLSLEPHKQAILLRAAKTADTITKLEEYAAGTGIETTGSMGQKVLNGAYAEIRQQTTTLNTLIKSMGFPDSDDEAAVKADRRSRAGKTAANARWGSK